LLICLGLPFMAQTDTRTKKPQHVLVLDAGHGGKDPGNLGTQRYSVNEKEVVLDVTLKVGQYVEENLDNVKVVYTRRKDVFVPLKKRAEIANEARGDLFVSIHADAFRSKQAHGTTSLVLGRNHQDENRIALQENSAILLEEDYEEKYQGFDPQNPQSMIALTLYQDVYLDQSVRLAKRIQEQFEERVQRRNRGIKQQPLYVTSRAAMPAVLVELGFLTNPNEEDFLLSEKGQTYMASAIYRAIKDYYAHQDSVLLENDGPEKPSAAVDGASTPALKSAEEAPADSDQAEPAQAQASSPEANPRPNGAVQFAIQLTTSASMKETSPENFKGLKGVKMLEESGLFKYYLPVGTRYDQAQQRKKELRANGFPGAFVIGVRRGQKISAGTARRLLR
jgi:N-acetylmuramoyl-L-alanine amidase